jgi:hypothetical protein
MDCKKITKKELKRQEKIERLKKERDWADRIKERDGWKCVICSDTLKPNAHHLIAREIPEFKYDLDNGITLCILHHKFSREISAHNNPFSFFIWVMKNRNEQYERLKEKYCNHLKIVKL